MAANNPLPPDFYNFPTTPSLYPLPLSHFHKITNSHVPRWFLPSSPSWLPPPDHSLLFNHFSLRPSESWPASHSLVPLLQQSPPQSTECRSTARDKSPEMEFCAQFNYIIILYEPNDIAPYNMDTSSCVSIQKSHPCSVTLFLDHHFGMAHRIFFVIRSYHHCHIANIVL